MRLQPKTRARVVAAMRHASAELRRAKESGRADLSAYWKRTMERTAFGVRRSERGECAAPGCAWCGRNRAMGGVGSLTCTESNRSACWPNFVTSTGVASRRLMPRSWQRVSAPGRLYVGMCVNCGAARVVDGGECLRCDARANNCVLCPGCGFVAVNKTRPPATCSHCGRKEFGERERPNPTPPPNPRRPRVRTSSYRISARPPDIRYVALDELPSARPEGEVAPNDVTWNSLAATRPGEALTPGRLEEVMRQAGIRARQ